MKNNIDFFLSWTAWNSSNQLLESLVNVDEIQQIHLIISPDQDIQVENEKCVTLQTENLTSTKFLRVVAQKSSAKYTALYLKETPLQLGYRCLERMLDVAISTGASMVYTDRYEEKEGIIQPHPTIDYAEGSVRDDFDFGGLWLVRTDLLQAFFAGEKMVRYRYAALYALRLFLSRMGAIHHLREYLYTEVETDLRKSGEAQFDYVNPSNREVQLENERACTEHLKCIGAYLAADELDELPNDETIYPVEASVIIPVRNRERTIADAIHSVLEQETDFDFNLIIVDNHSTDGTSEKIQSIKDGRIIHIIPNRNDLGIGGCWDLAIRNESCGRYAVQLDSDDLYSSKSTLQTIVDAFQKQKAAMVIGSYRMVNFNLETLPPGIIAHKEWTAENGRNNALRINGLGAPRAFRVDILRKIGFPNTSYGEDYALGLAFSRCFRIGRIYDELYLCRRWDGNSDAALPIEKINLNNAYKDCLRTMEIKARQSMIQKWNHPVSQDEVIKFFDKQMIQWEEVRKRFEDLSTKIETKELATDEYTLTAQFNPCRIVSTAAKVDKKNLKKRPCFLCDRNRPKEQIYQTVDGHYQVLVNPFPILPHHLTIPTRRHKPQKLSTLIEELNRMAWEMPEFIVFYNGGRCGASAPDHAHLQAGDRGIVPLEKDWKYYETKLEKIYPLTTADEMDLEEKGYISKSVGLYKLQGYACPAFVLQGGQAEGDFYLLNKLLNALPIEEGQSEPDMNLLAWRQSGGPADHDNVVMVLFPRRKHRPDCYYAEGKSQFVISPGALDMGGLIITPREEDFNKITSKQATSILREVCITESQMEQIAKKLNTRRNKVSTNDDITNFELSEEPEVSVGIMSSKKVSFTLNDNYIAKGDIVQGLQEVVCQDGGILWNGNVYSELTFTPETSSSTFTLHQVPFGINFHWERKESQTFRGTIRIIIDEEELIIINQLPVEEYIISVISSEMSANASPELLKAHAVISRSWLFHQIKKRRENANKAGGFFSFVRKEDEYIRWYDREDHTIFDVCADDHCQRYQGVTRLSSPNVVDAVIATRGQVLLSDGDICDARFSKCCGGITERYSTCWEDTEKSYLTPVVDAPNAGQQSFPTDIEEFIKSATDSFCNTNNKALLASVLNDYDQETTDFYRWTKTYTQKEISQLIREKREEDFGEIMDLIPVKRGESGRIEKLQIVGTLKTLTIGKELEIRRTLSDTHLYSSAFVVEKGELLDGIPSSFTLYGAGWGHGVGLCQIGAAVMADKGYAFKEILLHYYQNSNIKQLYK